MATIVTMDSNVIVASPKCRGYNREPELVDETLRFCLDGTQPQDEQQNQPPQQQQSQPSSSSNGCNGMNGKPPPPPLPPPHHNQQQPHRVEFVMKKGMSNERDTSTKTDSTADTTQSGSSPGGTTSSLSTLLASPNLANCAKTACTISNHSNISLQDMFDDDDVDDHHPQGESSYDNDDSGAYCRSNNNDKIKKGGSQDEEDEEEEDDEDFYSLTPPTTGLRKQPMDDAATSGATGTAPHPPPPVLMNGGGLMGTPPSTLYAPPSSTNQGSVTNPPASMDSTFLANSATTANTDASCGGLSVSPAIFPADGSTPPTNSIPQPVLYSAIGSLETCTAQSLKSIWKTKQTQHPPPFKFDSSNLIAPRQLQQRGQKQDMFSSRSNDPMKSDRQRSSPDAPDSAKSTPDKFGDNTNNNNNRKKTLPSPVLYSNTGTEATPTTALHQSAFEVSWRAVQEKIDARSRGHKHRHHQHHQNNNNSATINRSTSASATATADQHTNHANNGVHNHQEGCSTSTPSNNDNSSMSTAGKPKQPGASSMRKSSSKNKKQGSGKKSVKIDDASLQRKERKSSSRSKKPIEMFRPSCDAYTPRMERKKITYKPAEMRTPVQKMATTMGTLSRPNFRDALRRVAMLLRQHIVKIEQRFNSGHTVNDEGLFKMSMQKTFSEERFATCRYKCTVVRVPMARPGMVFGLKKIRPKFDIPTEEEIYEFAHQLFKTVQLSSECSIVCLIYIERLMEISKVPLLASTWRPIFMCGLLLASKVWQDLSSWNIEFASVYPQYSLEAINKLELEFLRMLKWDLYVSSR